MQDEVHKLGMDLKESQNRCHMLHGRAESVTRTLSETREENLATVRRVEDKTGQVGDLMAEKAELKAQIDMYRLQLSERCALHLSNGTSATTWLCSTSSAAHLTFVTRVWCRSKPSQELQASNTRLAHDCSRLVAMVEATTEYRKWAHNKAALRGVHYIPTAELLREEEVLSDIYPAERDREVDFEVEDFHWVPKRAVSLMITLLASHFPNLPVEPFMKLLTQLNQVCTSCTDCTCTSAHPRTSH